MNAGRCQQSEIARINLFCQLYGWSHIAVLCHNIGEIIVFFICIAHDADSKIDIRFFFFVAYPLSMAFFALFVFCFEFAVNSFNFQETLVGKSQLVKTLLNFWVRVSWYCGKEVYVGNFFLMRVDEKGE